MELPSDPLILLRATGSRLAVVYSTEHGIPLVYGLHRVGIPAFMRLAVGALAAARAESEAEREMLIGIAGSPTPEGKVAARKKIEAARAEHEQRLMTELAKSPERVAEMLDGGRGLVKASVKTVGFGIDGVAAGLHPVETSAADICQQLALSPDTKAPMYLRPIRWTDGHPDADGIDITSIPDLELLELGRLVAEAFMPREAASFRDVGRGPGSADDRGPVGPEVRPATGGSVRSTARSRRARSGGDGGG